MRYADVLDRIPDLRETVANKINELAGGLDDYRIRIELLPAPEDHLNNEIRDIFSLSPKPTPGYEVRGSRPGGTVYQNGVPQFIWWVMAEVKSASPPIG